MAIVFEKMNNIGIVTINRPKKMNCLNENDSLALGQVWREFIDDDSLNAAIITGSGDKAFCGGADLGDLIPKINSGTYPLRVTMEPFLKNIQCPKPIIAAVNGVCLAGGMEMLLGTDIRIASPNAVFGLPEVKLALFPGAGSTVRLPRQVPYCLAMEILLLGDSITAEHALRIGLINRIVEQNRLVDEAIKIAERICLNGPIAVKNIKQSVKASANLPQNVAYMIELNHAKNVFGTMDAVEGPKAFMENRKPIYKGK